MLDYTLNNPDTLTKYKTAAQISHKVLEAVSGMLPLLLVYQKPQLTFFFLQDGAVKERKS